MAKLLEMADYVREMRCCTYGEYGSPLHLLCLFLTGSFLVGVLDKNIFLVVAFCVFVCLSVDGRIRGEGDRGDVSAVVGALSCHFCCNDSNPLPADLH